MSKSLSPALVASVDDLEVVARLIVEGMRSGQHRSPFHGFATSSVSTERIGPAMT